MPVAIELCVFIFCATWAIERRTADWDTDRTFTLESIVGVWFLCGFVAISTLCEGVFWAGIACTFCEVAGLVADFEGRGRAFGTWRARLDGIGRTIVRNTEFFEAPLTLVVVVDNLLFFVE